MAQEQMQGNAAAPESAVVVKCGISQTKVRGVGKSVADLRAQCKKAINIDPAAQAVVDGVPVADEKAFIITEGMELEFVKQSGQKGI